MARAESKMIMGDLPTASGGVEYADDGAGNSIQRTAGVDVTKYLLDDQPSLAGGICPEARSRDPQFDTT